MGQVATKAGAARTGATKPIDELPPDDLQWQGGGAETQEANEERGQETLAGLKNLFG